MIQYLLPVDITPFLEPFVQDQSQMESIISKIQEAVLAQNPLKKKTFGTKTAYTLNLNIGRHYHRVVFEKVAVDGTDCYVLRGFAWMHDYSTALKWTPLVRATSDEVRNVYRSELVKFDCRSQIEADLSENMIYFKTNWYEPTTVQTEILACKQFPQLLVGPPGSGKTLIAMGLLQEQSLQHIENNQSDLLKLLFISGSPKLVSQAKKTWRLWEKTNIPQAYKRIIVSFLTVDEYNTWYAETCNLYQLSEKEQLNLLTTYFNKEFDCGKLLVELNNNAWRLTKDAEEKKPWDESLYKESGARHSLYDDKERALLYPQLLMILHDLQNKVRIEGKKIFFPGISVVTPDDDRALYDLAVLDEVQNTPVQSLLGIYGFSRNGQTILIGDSLQKGNQTFSALAELEPAIYSLFNRKLHVLTLSKTLRLLPDVAHVAHAIVQLYTNLNKGRADPLSYTVIQGPDGVHPLNQRCVSRLMSTEKESLTQIGTDPHAAVVVLSEEDKEPACRLINGANVFTHDEVQGIDFSQVLLYLSEQTLIRFVAVAKRMLERNITAESVLVDYPNLSTEKGNVDQLPLELLSNLLVGISRSYGSLWVYWDVLSPLLQHKLDPFIPWWSQTLGETAKPRVIPIIDTKPEDWLNRIHQFIEEGAIPQAKGNLCHIFLLDEQEATHYIALCQQGQSKKSPEALMSWVKGTRLPVQTVAPKTVPDTPSRTPAVTPLIPKELCATTVVEAPSSGVSMAFSPLSPKVSDWVEELYSKINNANNVKTLLFHTHALQILFHHPMKNGHCLWVNLALSNQLGTFLDYVKQDKEKVNLLIKGFEIAKNEQNTVLIFCFCVEEEKLSRLYKLNSIASYQLLKQEKHEKLSEICCHPSIHVNRNLLRYITQSNYFSTQHMPFLTRTSYDENGEQRISLLEEIVLSAHDFSGYSDRFLQEISIQMAPIFTKIPGNADCSFLWWMLSSINPKIDSVAFLIKILNFLPSLQREKILFTTTPYGIGPIHTSVFYFLYHNVQEIAYTKKHWSYLSKFIINNIPLFFEQEWDHSGTHFHALCLHARGSMLLNDLWDFFSPVLEKNPAYLFMPITKNGEKKGNSPFYNLCVSKATSCQSIPAHLSALIIYRHPFDTHLDFFIKLIDSNPELGIRSLHFLFSNHSVIGIVMKYITHFGPLVHKHIFHLLAQVTESGEEQGANLLYYLCSTPNGRFMLNELWDFWKPIIELDVSGLFAQISGDGDHQGKTALFHLCTSEEGLLILHDYFEFFEQVALANLEMPFAGIKYRDAVIDFENMFKNQTFSENLPLYFMPKKRQAPPPEEYNPPQLAHNPNVFFVEASQDETGRSHSNALDSGSVQNKSKAQS